MLTAADDLMHDPGTHRLFTETNWFGFVNVPDEGISFGIYIGFKPNLGVTYTWIVAWQGRHQHHMGIEYFDRRQYMQVPEITTEGYELDNGLKVSILEPLNKFKIEYADEPRKFGIDIVWSAICPAVAWTKSGHLDHFGHVKGQLTLKGKTYEVDTFSQRDHSWSIREDDEHMPAKPPKPFAWVWGAFSDSFAFQAAANWNVTDGTDFGETTATPIRGGGGEKSSWMWNGTESIYTSDIDFDIKWGGHLTPRAVALGFITETGQRYEFEGEVLSSALIPGTFIFSTLACQVRWHGPDGADGIGDFHLSINPFNYRGAGG
jgi:hypothetical protein